MAGFNLQVEDKMKIKSLKSQITMMIIVGLVLSILIGIVFYISKSTVKKTIQQGVKTTQSTALDTQPIKEFVSKCQDKLAKEAITLIGKQGGYIYKSQGGDLIDYSGSDQGIFFIMYGGNKVAYNIEQPPIYLIAPFSSTPPDYPWISFPYKDSQSNDQTFDGIFGLSNMPPLNNSQGPNSIQSQIESYIDNKMGICADLKTFTNEGYEISVNKSKTTATIASSDVRIKTSMPIRIINKATGEQTYIDAFSTSVNVRVQDIYYFAKSILSNDVTKINFDLKDVANNKNSFRIEVLDNIFSKDDIVIITDDKSQISGKQYEYRLARKNRAPALYYIKENIIQLPRDYMIYQDDLIRGSELNAEDPDEDSVRITITDQLNPTGNTPAGNPPGAKLFGREKFFVVVSYFDALRASDSTLDSDFAYLKSKGVGGIRIFPNWWNWNNGDRQAATDTLIDENGNLRQSQLDRLKIVLDKAKNKEFIVDVSFAREVAGQEVIDINEYKNGIIEAVGMIKQDGYKDILIDIQNEHNGGITYLSDNDVKDIRDDIKQIAPDYPLGASIAYDASTSYAIDAANVVNLDVILYHDPRTADWYQRTGQVVNELKVSGKPVYLEEPERWMPGSSLTSNDFMTAMTQAKSAGAAAWTFHTEAGFDLRSDSLQSQLSSVEREFLDSINGLQLNPIGIGSNLPVMLDRPQIKFRIEASDGILSDYQIITVNQE